METITVIMKIQFAFIWDMYSINNLINYFKILHLIVWFQALKNAKHQDRKTVQTNNIQFAFNKDILKTLNKIVNAVESYIKTNASLFQIKMGLILQINKLRV